MSMRTALFWLIASVVQLPLAALAGEISVERGRHVSIVGGCHDCHTDGYSRSHGKIDPAKALAGSAIGLRGFWGTTYPANLRLRVDTLTEDGFVLYLRS